MPSAKDNDGLKRLFKQSKIKPSCRTLLIGSKMYPDSDSRRTWYTGECLGVDIEHGPGVDLVQNIEEPIDHAWRGTFEHVDCCSVLEHVQRPWLAAIEIQSNMRKGASILLSVPFVWRVHGYPSDYWRMSLDAIPILFEEIAWRHLSYISNGVIVERPTGLVVKGDRFLPRTEVIGWGIKQGK
jgi:hypothetical protein